ncbi:hypothetical protein ES703_80614 [subsurface metagenome]
MPTVTIIPIILTLAVKIPFTNPINDPINKAITIAIYQGTYSWKPITIAAVRARVEPIDISKSPPIIT